MTTRRGRAAWLLVTLASSPALASPAGAPWGAADPAARDSCASCHFDADPEMNSAAIRLAGLPQHVEPGRTYVIDIVFPVAGAAGFMLMASHGDFSAEGADDLEANGGEIRSIAARQGDDRPWRVAWRAPDAGAQEIVFLLAVNEGNDDMSPFGDRIHYRKFTITNVD